MNTFQFTNDKQRITNEYEYQEGAPSPKYCFWDDWEKRQCHLWATDLDALLEMAFLLGLIIKHDSRTQESSPS
jgi:hypothetical protein